MYFSVIGEGCLLTLRHAYLPTLNNRCSQHTLTSPCIALLYAQRFKYTLPANCLTSASLLVPKDSPSTVNNTVKNHIANMKANPQNIKGLNYETIIEVHVTQPSGT